MFRRKEQDKSSETNFNEMELSDLLHREFKLIFVKRFTEVRSTMQKIRIRTKR